MYAGEDPARPQTLRRCPDSTHDHRGPAARAGRAPGRTRRPGRAVAALLDELGRRRCGGGPLVDVDGGCGADRLCPNDFLGLALAALPEHDTGRSLAAVLHDMGIVNVEALRSFRRLVAAEAAVAAVEWAAAPAGRADAAADALLRQIDDPSSAWR